MLRALSERGDEVDLVTYHEGENRTRDGVGLHRIRAFRFLSNIRPGFSVKKVCCDVLLFFKAFGLLRRRRYDHIHAVEESIFLAMAFKLFFRVPYVYDMDSSMAEQIGDRYRLRGWQRRVLETAEGRAARSALAVVAVCDALADRATKYGAENVFLLPDISFLDRSGATLRKTPAESDVRFLYVGNLEWYQGIDLLIDAFSKAVRKAPCRLMIVGGAPEHIDEYRARVRSLGIDDKVEFLGPKPLSELGQWLERADVLVSPRLSGTNTPMKLYSYLHSGRPVIATRIPAHTQVLDDECAMICEPDEDDLARAMIRLANDENARLSLGENGRLLAEREYTYEAFKRRLEEICNFLESVR